MIRYVESCSRTGERLNGISGEAAAQKLRGHIGTSVSVKVHNVSLLVIHILSVISVDNWIFF